MEKRILDLNDIGCTARDVFIEIEVGGILSHSQINVSQIYEVLGSVNRITVEDVKQYTVSDVSLIKTNEKYMHLHKSSRLSVGYRIHIKYMGLMKFRAERVGSVMNAFVKRFAAEKVEVRVYLARQIDGYELVGL